MNTKKIGFILFFLFSVILIAQERKGFFAADEWEGFPWVAKLYFITGIANGELAQTSAVLDILKNTYKWNINESGIKFIKECKTSIFSPNLEDATYGQIVTGVDELYKDYANKHIPVFALASLVAKRISGKINNDEVEPFLQKLRNTKWSK